MAPGGDAVAMLEAMPQPALLVDAAGMVAAANRRARAMLASLDLGRGLPALAEGEGLARYLDRCRGSSEGLVGVLPLGGHRTRCRGARASLGDWSGVLLTLEPPGTQDRFLALTRKVEELDREVRERRHAEAVLSETVRDRDLLLRELQHRVKNNMHMLAALLQGAEREAASPEARTALRDAAQRFGAVSAVQQMIYARDLDTIDAAEVVPVVAQAASGLALGGATLVVEAEPVPVPIEAAVSLALVINELVTNAAKHGRPAQGLPAIRVAWRVTGDEAELRVEDNGPGFEGSGPGRRASGIGLVRGLLRQLGGSFAIEAAPGGGACCLVRLPWTRLRKVAP